MDLAKTKLHGKQACELCYEAASQVYRATIVKNQLLSWYFYVLLGLILFLEWAKPVYSKASVLSVAFFHDCLWFFLDALFLAILMPIYQIRLSHFYHSYLGWLRVGMIETWPLAGQILVAVLVSDFIRWFHHLLRHKILLFWYFHTVHHSQRDMNLFTDLRVHPVERLIEAGIAFIPFLSLRTDIALASLAGWHLFGSWYARFYHSNVKTDLGILRYIIVTPQSHRIHHSLKMEHRDKNFGAIFSVWDRLFGTQYRVYDKYPETGLDDPGFPHETELGWHRTIGTFLCQLVYPFQLAFRSAIGFMATRQAA